MPTSPIGRRSPTPAATPAVTAPAAASQRAPTSAAPPAPSKVGSDGWTTGPQRALVPPPGTAPTLEVDRQHPVLQKLARSRLSTGPTGSCVATTLGNMDRLGIPSFSGGTRADPNNSRGALVQPIKGGHWASVPLADSTVRTLRSPYGTVQAHVMSADAYERLAKRGEIPSGALIFQTRHGWSYGGGASGNDMGIVRDRGRTTHNYASMPPVIYKDAKEIVLLVPKAALRPVAAPASGA